MTALRTVAEFGSTAARSPQPAARSPQPWGQVLDERDDVVDCISSCLSSTQPVTVTPPGTPDLMPGEAIRTTEGPLLRHLRSCATSAPRSLRSRLPRLRQ
ncbi:hypothetical protein ACFQ6B_03235 [Streptomyces wedmorensis]|uniref:Uncharacterized protein n=1 Tax=Streptomyces wedmorensis TaxID=43759 RepID=A0ABW6J376_STRWE